MNLRRCADHHVVMSVLEERKNKMEAKVVEIKKMVKVSLLELDIPDGTYNGTWGEYEVTFKVGDVVYSARTDNGIRAPFAACKVGVFDGNIKVFI